MEVRLPIDEFRFLKCKLNKKVMNMLTDRPDGEQIIVGLNHHFTGENFGDEFIKIVVDTMTKDYEATEDTYHLEYIWDNYLIDIEAN